MDKPQTKTRPLDHSSTADYQKYIKAQIAKIRPILIAASIGDFSHNIKIPTKEDEFTDLYVGLQIMVEVVREQTKELQQLNTRLAKNLADRTLALQRELEESAKREAILSSVGEGLIVTDKQGKIALANPRALQMLGYKSAKQIYGHSYHKIFVLINEQGKVLPAAEHPVVTSLTKRRKVIASDLWCRRQDRTTFPLIITSTPVMSGQALLGAVKVFRDISPEKAVERSKSEFVLLASHQLRTPLSIIKWYGQLLARQLHSTSPRQEQYLTEIDQGTRRMSDIITDLLDVAQIESGMLKYEPIKVAAASFMNRLLKELDYQIKSKDIRIVRRLPKPLPKLMTDPKLLRIVFQNLLTNSIKYMDTGGRITISIVSRPAGSSYVGVQVKEASLGVCLSDQGYGIPTDQQAWVFSKMFRASNVKDRPVEGSGVGLFIAKSVVDFLGGRIWFRSQLDKGTSFYVLLPLRSGVK